MKEGRGIATADARGPLWAGGDWRNHRRIYHFGDVITEGEAFSVKL